MNKFLPNRKGVLALLLALFAGMGTAYAYDFSATCSTGQTLYYNIIDATNRYVEITYPGTSTSNPWEGYTQPTGNITLPSTVTYNGNTYTVKRIGDYAFYTCSGLTGSLTLPNSVTTIGHCAFIGCRGFTGSLTLPSSVTSIGMYAFYQCIGFTGSLTLPNSVTTIASCAFFACSGFTGTLTLPNSVTRIDYCAFYYCSGFTGTLTLPSSLTTIGEKAFAGCSGFTGSLTLPNSVTTIGESAFQLCSGFTGSLTIGNSVISIGGYAFNKCSGFTGSLSISNSVTTIGNYAFYDCSGFTGSLTIGSSVTTIGGAAFHSCNGFTGSLTIPNSVTTIGGAAFYNCSGFTGSLSIGNSVASIGNNAFKNCTGLTGSLTLPNSMASIGNSAFENCSGFTGSLTIGTGVTSISEEAFSYCTGFTSMTVYPETPPTLGENAFMNISATIPVTVPCGTLNAYQNASGWNAFSDIQEYCDPDPLTYSINADGVSVTVTGHVDGTAATGELVIPETKTINGVTYTVTAIGNNAFDGCTGLTGSLTIPNSVTTIGYRAFSDCSGFMGSLTIPNSVTTIGFSAFRDCSGFTGSLTISNSVTTIGHWTFLNCSGFTGSLIIPNSVTTIGMYAFENCSGFTGSLTIPNSVTSIGNDAFHGCSGFTGSLTISSSVTTIDYGTFWNCSGFTGSLIIPNSVTSIGMYAFRNCSGFTGSLTLGNSVTSIGMSAFQDCSGFTGNLTIPNSVTSIGVEAFGNCSGFTGSLTIPNSVTSIGVEAFGNCSGFTGSLTLPNSVTSIGNYAFYNCTGFTGSLTLPNSVTSIGNYTFYNCTGFTGSLTLPNSVTSIGNYAFYNCTGFTGSLTLPNSVASIGNAAFRDCSGFTGTLTLPNSVTSIGNYAFYNCYGFTGTLTLPSSVTTIGDEAFRNCYGFTSMIVYPETPPTLGTYVFFGVPKTIPVTVPCGTLSAYQNFSGWNAFTNLREYCDPLTYSINADGVSVTVTGHVDGTAATGELIIPETKTINGVTYTVTAIGNNAFNGCTGLTGSLTIPNSVTAIGSQAFRGCTGLTGSLTLPNSVTTIGNYAFYSCSGFTGSLTLPNSVTTIGDYAFRSCHSFTGSLTIPNSVTEIGEGAFAYCSGFTGSLTIGNSVTTIGSYAFQLCSGLTGTLTLPNSVTTIGNYAFRNCSGFTGSLTLPNSVTSIGSNAFRGCSGFTGSLTIGNSVTAIGQSAFYDCTGFTGSLTIGNSVTLINSDAFYNCTGLTSMTVYPQTPPTMALRVFYNVPTTIPVYVFCSSLEDYQAASQWSAFTNMQCIQETLTVYDGTNSSNCLPAYIIYFDEFTRSQFVIPAADLADMTGAPISSMTFYTTGSNVPYTTVSSADVYLKEVNYTHISAFEPKASSTIVYSGYLDIVSTGNGGEMTINFNTPYTYNGGNLLVGIENTENNGWKSITFYGKTVSGASVSGRSSSSLESVQPAQQNFIPKTTFSYTLSACSTPTALTATDITSNSAMLQWTGFQDEYDMRYRTKPLFFEDFENGLPEGWTTIDNDGDGYNWISSTSYSSSYCHSGTGLMYSQSWINNVGSLTPDNWLITPQIELQGTMKVWLRALDPSYLDHFTIYLSTTGNSVSDFTTVLVPETTSTTQYVAYTADLSAYIGQQGYIAICHNSADRVELLLDDFGIFNNPDETEEWVTLYNIGSSYSLGALEPATEYEWRVRGRHCDGSGTYTGWSAARSFTTECEALVVDGGNPFTEDFEGTDFGPACWENIPSGSYKWVSTTDQSHSSSRSAYSGWYGDIYLVLPDLELSANAPSAQLSFWSYNTYPSDFAEGYNTVVLLNGGTETVLWSAETVEEEWVGTTIDLTDYLGQTVSLAFKYAGDNGNGWYVDDVEVSVTASISLTGGDWHLIASPLESVSPDDIPGMTTGDYDLYRFEPSATDQEWRNFKNTPFSLQSGQGYLYAHGTDVTLVFDGTSYTSTELVEVSLVYDANDSHKCWNLVGNPYKCKAYLNKECYMLNAEGTGINPEPLPVGTPIPPYTAVFVKAIATGDKVVFTKTVP